MASDRRLEEETLGGFHAVASMARLFRYTRGRRIMLSLAVTGSLIASGLQIGMPLLVRQGVDMYMTGRTLAPANRIHALVSLGWIYALLLLALLGGTWAGNLGLNVIGQQVVMAVRHDVFAHLHRLPIPYFDRNPIGRLVTRVANDTDALFARAWARSLKCTYLAMVQRGFGAGFRLAIVLRGLGGVRP